MFHKCSVDIRKVFEHIFYSIHFCVILYKLFYLQSCSERQSQFLFYSSTFLNLTAHFCDNHNYFTPLPFSLFVLLVLFLLLFHSVHQELISLSPFVYFVSCPFRFTTWPSLIFVLLFVSLFQK